MKASTAVLLCALLPSISGKAPNVPAPLFDVADRTLSAVERRASELRQRLTTTKRAVPLPTVWDAVAVGGVSGWLCGVVLVGRPDVMAIAGISACAFAQQKQPDNRFGRLANRAAGALHSARTSRLGLPGRIKRVRKSLKTGS
jgi:hypothetical protein